MDKKEYQEKLQEINRLIAAEDYEGAARIADSIDWKRVRNVQTLVMVSEVYEVLERYEDSKVLLLRAYRRSPVGRTVLYRLVECCIKLRQFDQAIEYYSEYVQAAPHDNNKYILKYKIYRGRGSSLDEQIDILKEYLDQEYNEKWAYELARIEIQAGRVQEGLATCDDLVLWFHSGKYVIKALELKKKYAPLTPKQQEIYDNRFDEEEDEPEIRPESYLSEAASLAKAERAAAAQEEIKTELAADISHTAKMEATKAELSRKAQEAQAEVDRKADESRKALSEAADVMSEAADEKPEAADEKPEAAEEKPETAEAVAGAAALAVAASAVAGGVAAQAAEEAADQESAAEAAREEEPVMSLFRDEAGEAESALPETDAKTSAEAGQSTPDLSLFAEGKSVLEQESAVEESAAEAALPQTDAAASAEDGQAASDMSLFAEGKSIPEQESAFEESTAGEGASQETPAEPAASEAAQEDSYQKPASPEQMQEDMIRSMREIVSGVGPKEQITEDEAVLEEAIEQSKEDQENAVAARGTDMTFRVPTSEASQKRQAGKLTIDDILLSMGDRGDHVRQVTGGSVMSATEEAEMTAQHQAEAKAASYDGMPPVSEPDEPRIPAFLREEVHEARQTSEIPAVEIAEADDAMRAQMGLESRDEAAAASMAEAAALGSVIGMTGGAVTAGQEEAGGLKEEASPEEEADGAGFAAGIAGAAGAAAVLGGMSQGMDGDADQSRLEGIPGTDTQSAQAEPASGQDEAAAAAAFMSAPKVEYTKEIAEAKTRRLPVDEIRKLHEAYLTENSEAAAQEAAKNAAQAAEIAAEKAEAEAAGQAAPSAEEDVKVAHAPGEAAAEGAGFAAGAAGAAAAAQGFAQADDKVAGAPEKEADKAGFAAGMAGAAGAGAAIGGMPQTDGRREQSAGAPVKEAGDGIQGGPIGEQVTREVPKSEPDPQVFTGRQYLKDNQMDLFRGFTSIGNLSEQIAGAIWQAEHRRDDRTSRSGNILILGAHGCGKTTIATGIAKAIAEDMGTHSVKMARIYAADLNRKDIAATIAKIAGGVLIVEEAGDLDDAIVDQLTTAMEFRTDGLIMILEDEQRYIHDLLMRHPRFTMKFTAQIYIPEYTGEQLVDFGQIYANSKDYVFSEKAVEACLARVESAKKSGEAVSVTNVIELVDRAIKNANTFFRRIGSAKKRYDSEDRIILREKDFR